MLAEIEKLRAETDQARLVTRLEPRKLWVSAIAAGAGLLAAGAALMAAAVGLAGYFLRHS